MKRLTQHSWFHPLQLLAWIGVGTALRFTGLTSKPLWTDEFATIVFSLGRSFRTIPLNQVISTATLLQPLQAQAIGSPVAVVQSLMSESTHPPLYFLLMNFWIRVLSSLNSDLFATDGLVSVAAARSLPALLGILAIPAMFGLGWVATRSRWVSQLAAALMAVSPFGIALAQEARHYTLALLWVIASLTCLTIALRQLSDPRSRSTLPLAIALLWIVINALGIATHYFFVLTLVAAGVTLFGLWLSGYLRLAPRLGRRAGGSGDNFDLSKSFHPVWRGISWVAIGTLISALVWLPAVQKSRDREITQWIYGSDAGPLDWFSPISHTIASLMTMVTLLPVQGISQPLIVASGTGVALFSLWLTWIVSRSLWRQARSIHHSLIRGLVGLVGSAIGVLLLLDYGLGTDLTRGLRYNFIYFPAVLLLVAIGLAATQNRKWVAIVLTAGWIGSLTVGFHLGLQKVHQPDQVVRRIASHSKAPIVVAIAHHTHGQTGRLMGIAWELRQLGREAQFYLDHQTCDADDRQRCDRPTAAFRAAIADLPRPVDLWLLNFQAQPKLSNLGCKFDQRLKTRRVDGYKYQRYRCRVAKQ